MKPFDVTKVALTAFYAALWLGGVASYLFLNGPPAGSEWTAPVFLAVAGALAVLFSPREDLPILLLSGVVGFVAEALGTATGFPFGRYRYTAALYPQIQGVPLVLAAAWLVLFAYVRQLVRSPLATAAWITAIDLVVDPLAAGRLGFWRWEQPGIYYGIPWTNFAGWFGVSLLLFLLARKPAALEPRVCWLGLSVVVFFTVIALGAGLWLAGTVGIGLIILHASRTRLGGCQSARSTVRVAPVSPAR